MIAFDVEKDRILDKLNAVVLDIDGDKKKDGLLSRLAKRHCKMTSSMLECCGSKSYDDYVNELTEARDGIQRQHATASKIQSGCLSAVDDQREAKLAHNDEQALLRRLDQRLDAGSSTIGNAASPGSHCISAHLIGSTQRAHTRVGRTSRAEGRPFTISLHVV